MNELIIYVLIMIICESGCQWTSSYRYGCGFANPDGIGFRFIAERNNVADFGKFPWTAAIMKIQQLSNKNITEYVCSGAIIAPNAIITAGSCLVDADDYLVRGGEWDLSNELEQLAHQDRNIKKIKFHNDFFYSRLHNDIALVILETPFEFDDHIQSICLPDKESNFQYSNCFVSGWGSAMFAGKIVSLLKEVHYNVIPQSICEASADKFFKNEKITVGQFCGKFQNNDICQGSSGAPMACPVPFEQNRFYLAGIVSSGVLCNIKDTFTIFTNITYYHDWIDTVLTDFNVDSNNYIYVE